MDTVSRRVVKRSCRSTEGPNKSGKVLVILKWNNLDKRSQDEQSGEVLVGNEVPLLAHVEGDKTPNNAHIHEGKRPTLEDKSVQHTQR